MERIVIDVPKMYADHHVERVREALLQLDGVADLTASSAFRRVIVHYDPGRSSPEAIEKALVGAGYAPAEDWDLPTPPKATEEQSSWFRVIQRVTRTNALDLEMSGDFRKY